MATGNLTIAKGRRATVAKATKRNPARKRPVEWGYDGGRPVVIRASGHWQHDLPADRWRDLRNTIDDMGQVVRAFDGTHALANDGQRLTMLSMAVARALMLEAESHMRAVLALSPAMRDAIAKVEARMGKGGAA